MLLPGLELKFIAVWAMKLQFWIPLLVLLLLLLPVYFADLSRRSIITITIMARRSRIEMVGMMMTSIELKGRIPW